MVFFILILFLCLCFRAWWARHLSLPLSLSLSLSSPPKKRLCASFCEIFFTVCVFFASKDFSVTPNLPPPPPRPRPSVTTTLRWVQPSLPLPPSPSLLVLYRLPAFPIPLFPPQLPSTTPPALSPALCFCLFITGQAPAFPPPNTSSLSPPPPPPLCTTPPHHPTPLKK